jgi:hypothetical protein
MSLGLSRQSASLLLTVAVAVGLLAAGCGGSTPSSPATVPSAAASSSSPAGPEAAVRSLYAALKRAGYSAACNDYTPDIQGATILAASKIAATVKTTVPGKTCADALAFIIRAEPGSRRIESDLGPLRFSYARVESDQAVLKFASRLNNGLVAHSTVIVQREFGRWLAGRATSLTFTHQ